jgi:hypothetical protein
MVRWRIGLIMLAVVAAVAWLSVGEVIAGPLSPDPIVRVRGGGDQIPVNALPFTFDFGTFPVAPDNSNCFAYTDYSTEVPLPLVGCAFQNQTGTTISFLQLAYLLGQDSGGLVFTAEDPDGLFGTSTANSLAATFTGGGIPSCVLSDGVCIASPPLSYFEVDLVGFPDGTTAAMTASTVPDPGATLLLFGMGLAGLTAFRRWRG